MMADSKHEELPAPSELPSAFNIKKRKAADCRALDSYTLRYSVIYADAPDENFDEGGAYSTEFKLREPVTYTDVVTLTSRHYSRLRGLVAKKILVDDDPTWSDLIRRGYPMEGESYEAGCTVIPFVWLESIKRGVRMDQMTAPALLSGQPKESHVYTMVYTVVDARFDEDYEVIYVAEPKGHTIDVHLADLQFQMLKKVVGRNVCQAGRAVWTWLIEQGYNLVNHKIRQSYICVDRLIMILSLE